MPLDLSQPLHWDEEDVLKWFGTLNKGKLLKGYSKKLTKANLDGPTLLGFENSEALSTALGFGSKRKELKDLRTIWQSLSTLKEKTKASNFLEVKFNHWDEAKFMAWLHSPQVRT